MLTVIDLQGGQPVDQGVIDAAHCDQLSEEDVHECPAGHGEGRRTFAELARDMVGLARQHPGQPVLGHQHGRRRAEGGVDIRVASGPAGRLAPDAALETLTQLVPELRIRLEAGPPGHPQPFEQGRAGQWLPIMGSPVGGNDRRPRDVARESPSVRGILPPRIDRRPLRNAGNLGNRHAISVPGGCHNQERRGRTSNLDLMPFAAANTSFAIVFTLFVVVTLVLVVLVLRFTFQRASVARSQWLAEQDDSLDDDEQRGFTALVLAGGGVRGAVQIGMLQVLSEHGFVPDRIYGSSVGAVNGVAFAGDPTRAGVERMTEIWTGLTREAVYPQSRLHGPWLYLQQRDSVYPNSGLRAVIEEGVTFQRLEDAVIPVEVVATSLTDGHERWFTYGSVVDAVLASAAVPAIFPPIEIDGERFIDGGVVDNVPIRRAIDAGATRIVVLLCAPPVYSPTTPKRPAEAMLNALFISIHARFARDMAQLPPGVEIIVCSGYESGTPDFDDFSTTQALIAQGREEASEVVRRYGLGQPGVLASAAPFDSPDGTDGLSGTGLDGAAGADVVRRVDGAVGVDGAEGVDAAVGAVGAHGAEGANGVDGAESVDAAVGVGGVEGGDGAGPSVDPVDKPSRPTPTTPGSDDSAAEPAAPLIQPDVGR